MGDGLATNLDARVAAMKRVAFAMLKELSGGRAKPVKRVVKRAFENAPHPALASGWAARSREVGWSTADWNSRSDYTRTSVSNARIPKGLLESLGDHERKPSRPDNQPIKHGCNIK